MDATVGSNFDTGYHPTSTSVGVTGKFVLLVDVLGNGKRLIVIRARQWRS